LRTHEFRLLFIYEFHLIVLRRFRRLLDWKLNRAEDNVSKTDRVVIFKKMFDVKEFEVKSIFVCVVIINRHVDEVVRASTSVGWPWSLTCRVKAKKLYKVYMSSFPAWRSTL